MTDEAKFGLKVGLWIVAVIVLIVVLLGSMGTIQAGERGVKTRLGAVVGIINPGFYMKVPFIERVRTMDVRTQSLTASKEQPLGAASSDLQDTFLAVVVNYHIQPDTVMNIYQQYGSADTYYHNVVEPLIVATVKATASQYSAAEQIQKRQEMSDKTLVALQLAFDGKNVAIEKADITNIDFDPGYKASIEKKVTAIQDAITAQNKLVQVQAEADQRVAAAKGEAEAIKIQAQAINSQGGADYVKLKTVEKWNGAGCTSYCGLESSTGLLVTGK